MDILNRSSLVVRLPAPVQAEVTSIQTQVRRKAGADLVRWTPAHELVLTMVPLGEISPSQIAQINSVLGPIVSRFAAPEVILEGLGGSPTNLQPRFLWIGMPEAATFTQLVAEIEVAIRGFLYDFEPRGFQAHLPIGRLKQESEANRTAVGRAIRVAGVGAVARFQSGPVELVRASSTSLGPTLVTVQSFPFA